MAMLNPGVMRTGIMRSGVMASGIMVDNSSPTPPFTPASLSGLVGWYDAQDAATITQSGGAVSQWNDKSPSAINVSQLTSAQQPTYSATSFPGSHPAITFLSNNGLLGSSAFGSALSDFTFFIVSDIASSLSTFPGILAIQSPVSGRVLASIFTNESAPTGAIDFYTDQLSPTDAFSVTPVTDAALYFCVKRDASGAVTFRINGVADSSSATMTPLSISVPSAITYIGYDGFSSSCNGQLGEIILYDRLLSLAEIGQIESYLSARWSL